MQKTENSVSFTGKQTQKLQSQPVMLAKKKNEMKVKVRHEIRQVFH